MPLLKVDFPPMNLYLMEVDEHKNVHSRPVIFRERKHMYIYIYICEHKGGEIQRTEIDDVIS
jgi:hypothetical protein